MHEDQLVSLIFTLTQMQKVPCDSLAQLISDRPASSDAVIETKGDVLPFCCTAPEAIAVSQALCQVDATIDVIRRKHHVLDRWAEKGRPNTAQNYL
jgi:uncharacterized protein YaeQ